MELSFAVHKLANFSSNPGKVNFEGLVYILRYIWDNHTLVLEYDGDMNDALLYELLRQSSIKTENHLMDFYDFSWQDFPYTGRSTGAYIIFYQSGPIYHGIYVPVPVDQSSAESEYNEACTAGMALAHFRVLIHELLNKDPYIVTWEAPIIVLDGKSLLCVANNGKDNKHTRHIARRMHLVMSGENFKMHKIDWCEGGLQLSYISTKNVGEHDLTPIMIYIVVIIDN